MGAVTPQDVKENDGLANMTNPMVGAAGFEPTNAGVKVLCLTAWL